MNNNVSNCGIAKCVLACVLLPGAAKAGNVTFTQCEGGFNGYIQSSLFTRQDVNKAFVFGNKCVISESLEREVSGGSPGSTTSRFTIGKWQSTYASSVMDLGGGQFVHAGSGLTSGSAEDQGDLLTNGTWGNFPSVESSSMTSLYRFRFTVDAPTLIRLKGKLESRRKNTPVSAEDTMTLTAGSTELWRVDGAPTPGNSGVFESVLVPGVTYILQVLPGWRTFADTPVGSPKPCCEKDEDYSNWSYELRFNYAPTVIDLASVSLSSTTVAGCKNVTGKITLTAPAPTGGFKVALVDTLAAATTPATVTVPAAALTKSFTIKTTPVATSEIGTVTVTGADQIVSQPLTVRPMGLSSVTLTPTSAVGGSQVTGKATLECKAVPGAVLVDLASSNAAVATPVAASIAVPQGLQSVNFDVTTRAVQAKSYATIAGTANGITKSKKLTVNVAAAVSPTRLGFGSVTVNTTSGVLNATLTNKGATAFSVSSIGLTGTNAKYYAQTNNCPSNLAAGASCTVAVTFKPTVTGSKSATLSIATSATSTPLKVALSGTGI